MNKITFGDEISSIKENIIENINQYNAKQERDIIILIDFNIYTVFLEIIPALISEK